MPYPVKQYTYNGLTLTVAEWAELVGIRKQTLRARLNIGWSMAKALAIPAQKQGTRTDWWDEEFAPVKTGARIPGTLDQVPARNWMTPL